MFMCCKRKLGSRVAVEMSKGCDVGGGGDGGSVSVVCR